MKENFQIQCDLCGFCSDRCPMEIPIPGYFGIYNQFLSGNESKAAEKFKELSAEKALPDACIRCGRCEQICPNHLPIVGFLEDIAEEL